MIPRLRNKFYEERLKELNFSSLSKRRLRWDLIEVFKVFHGVCNNNLNNYVIIDLTSTVTMASTIIGERCQSNEERDVFFNRIVNIWNVFYVWNSEH